MEYLLVKAADDKILNDKVRLAINKGYEPIGGIAMQNISSFRGEVIVYAQAMVKYDNKQEEKQWDNI